MKASTVWVLIVAFLFAAGAVSASAANVEPVDVDRRQSAEVTAAMRSSTPERRGTPQRWVAMNAGGHLELTEDETGCLVARDPLLDCVDARTGAQLLISSTFAWFSAGRASHAVAGCLDQRWADRPGAHDELTAALYEGAPLGSQMVTDLNVCVPPPVAAAALTAPDATPTVRCAASRFAATQPFGELVAAARVGDEARLEAAAAAETEAFRFCEEFPIGSMFGPTVDMSLFDGLTAPATPADGAGVEVVPLPAN